MDKNSLTYIIYYTYTLIQLMIYLTEGGTLIIKPKSKGPRWLPCIHFFLEIVLLKQTI